MPAFTPFKDLSVTFKSHPVTGDLVTVKDEAAVKQAIVNLLLTNKGERFFNPDLGCGIPRLLFEPLDYGTAALIQNEVFNTLRSYEPRIEVTSVIATPVVEENAFEVSLEFVVVGRSDSPVNVNFLLERSR